MKAIAKKSKKPAKGTKKKSSEGDIDDIMGILGKRKDFDNNVDAEGAKENKNVAATTNRSQMDVLSATDTLATGTSESMAEIDPEASLEAPFAAPGAQHVADILKVRFNLQPR